VKRPQLIPDWRRAWRWWSVQTSALIVVWVALPPDTQAALVSLFGFPTEKVPGVLAVLCVVGRMLQQPAKKGDDQ
jgi:hypothetical protein